MTRTSIIFLLRRLWSLSAPSHPGTDPVQRLCSCLGDSGLHHPQFFPKAAVSVQRWHPTNVGIPLLKMKLSALRPSYLYNGNSIYPGKQLCVEIMPWCCSTVLMMFLFLSNSLPQYVYPSAYMAAAATPGVGLSVSPASPLSPTTASQFFDYPAAAAAFPAAAAAAQFATANGFEAAYPYTTNASYMAAPAAAYSYAVPQPVGHFAHFQPQQIPERMQWARPHKPPP